jgi:5-enolpyruvylshikimate-3-phosphate synthase
MTPLNGHPRSHPYPRPAGNHHILVLFGRTIAALKKAKAAGKNGLSVIEQEIDMKRLDDAVPIIEAVTAVADQEILVAAAERYGVFRRFSPRRSSLARVSRSHA